jgi:2-amino-4-hydroxy-6-hydroxymethyldihydropteridine diphosphokinase
MVSLSGAEVKPPGRAAPPERWVVCALGSNQGDREAHLAFARRRLPAAGFPWTLASSVHETAAVGGPAGQPAFLNQVLAAPLASVGLGPDALLVRLLELEREAGRRRRERWGPRTLDIDLVFHGDDVRDEPGLILPHPRMQERPFVLAPLAEILPELVHPVSGRTVREMLRELGGEGKGS